MMPWQRDRRLSRRSNARISTLTTPFGVPLKLLEQAQNTRMMFIAMMGLLAGISLLVGGIGIMNIMLANGDGNETREIGIRRALGARRGDITRQFLIETILLSVAGGITGILAGLTCGSALDLFRRLMDWAMPQVMQSLPATVQSMEPIVIPVSISDRLRDLGWSGHHLRSLPGHASCGHESH